MKQNLRLLSLVLDELIPPRADRSLPGAGTLGVGALVDRAAASDAELASLIGVGLAALEEIARRRDAAGFAALAPAERVQTLRELEAVMPMFVQAMLTLACVGYYSAEPVLLALKGDARPPHPRGYELEPDDWSMLARVRARGRLYREC